MSRPEKLRIRIPYYLPKEKKIIEKTIVMMAGVTIRRIFDWGNELEIEILSSRPTWQVQEEVARLASRLNMPYTIE